MRKHLLNVAVVVSIFLSLFSMSVPSISARSTSNGDDIGSGPPGLAAVQSLPTVPAATMPVFAILPTQVNSDIIMGNAGKFNGIGATGVISETSRGGLNHFYAFNPENGDMVDQFDHTGGLFAINYSRAYTETTMDFEPNVNVVCRFLLDQKLFPAEIEPQYKSCGNNPPYITKMIHLTKYDPSNGRSTETTIGELVQVPLAIDIGGIVPVYVPLGGPGGHMSLLFAGNSNTPSMDDILPGFQGLAYPWFGRMHDPTPIGFYPTVPAAVAIERFKALYSPDAAVDAGTPVMEYYVGFPDVPQDALMPMWTFPDATAVISGTVVSLKDSALPAVEGFAPDVTIQSPADGAVYLQNQPASITFNITGDKGPFTYTVSADSTTVATGVAISGTAVTLNLGVLPFSGDRSAGHDLSVHAVNTYNQPGDASVFLGAASSVYLPVSIQSSGGGQPSLSANNPTASAPTMPDSNWHVGVEWVMNYHNPGLNLGQTQPDAEGFYNWLGAIGWGKTFDYGNDAAWEKDWRDCTLGGGDCTYGVDRTQFAYFSGHGSPSSWYFGVSRDYSGAWGGNSRFQTVRWAAFSSCMTVRAGPYVGQGDPPLTDWFKAFKGLYMILGFHSVMGDVPFGGSFGLELYNPIYTFFPWMQPSVAAAWVNTAFAMNAGKPAYLYAVSNTFNPLHLRLPAGNSASLPPLTGITQFRWVWWDE